MEPSELVERFQFFDDWQDRYRYLVDLGRKVEGMAPEDLRDEYLVPGCMSRVWLKSAVRMTDQGAVLDLQADSDAIIAKGLVAIVLMLFSGRTAREILALDVQDLFERLELDSHVTVNRRNGFYSMLMRIKELATANA